MRWDDCSTAVTCDPDLSAQFEHMVDVTEADVEVCTLAPRISTVRRQGRERRVTGILGLLNFRQPPIGPKLPAGQLDGCNWYRANPAT